MVRNRSCGGEKFRREHPIERYTADFCCLRLKLIIEVDGEGHFTDEGMNRDRKRDKYLSDLGYRILRISGFDVMNDPLGVRRRIVSAIESLRAE